MFSPMTFDERERKLFRLPFHTRDNTTQTQALASLPTPYITCTTESSSFIDSSSLFQVHESHTPVNPNVTSTHVNTVTSDRLGIGHNMDLRYGHVASTPGFVGHREMHTPITGFFNKPSRTPLQRLEISAGIYVHLCTLQTLAWFITLFRPPGVVCHMLHLQANLFLPHRLTHVLIRSQVRVCTQHLVQWDQIPILFTGLTLV